MSERKGDIKMIELSNTTAQTLQPGQSIIFDNVIIKTGCGECYRNDTSSVKMRGNGVYQPEFHGNVTADAAGTVQLNLTLTDNTILPETQMNATIATANDLHNVGTATLVKNCCGDYDRISVTNTGTTACIVAANSCLKLRRLS